MHVDGTAFQAHTKLEHHCEDRQACRELMKRQRAAKRDRPPPKHLANAGTESVKAGRDHDNGLPEDQADDSVMKMVGLDDEYRYYIWQGHRYRSRDRSATVRMHGGKGRRKRKVWNGGLSMAAIDHFTGLPLALHAVTARVNEGHAYPELYDKLLAATGEAPIAVADDRGYSHKVVFEHNTRRGVRSVFPWRKPRADIPREQVDTEKFDRHGVPRCNHCGGPGYTRGEGLGLAFTDRQPRIRFICRIGFTADCKDQVQSVNCSHEWRLLVPIDRLTETYHALRRSHSN